MTSSKLSMQLRNSLSELEQLGEHLEKFGRSHGLSQKALFEICLSMEKLITNIISYGYEDETDHWIQVAISHDNGIITIRLEDDGMPFDPLEAEEPDCECHVEQRKVGNLGIHLTKKVMDSMVYERSGDRNILVLTKRLEKS